MGFTVRSCAAGGPRARSRWSAWPWRSGSHGDTDAAGWRSCPTPRRLAAPLPHRHVEPGATVITDGWMGYHGITGLGYAHVRRSQRAARARGEDPGKLLPGSTGSPPWPSAGCWAPTRARSRTHLQSYLNEFCFRFNRRRSSSRGLVFYRVLELAVGHDPVRYRDLADCLMGFNKRSFPRTVRARAPGSAPRPRAERSPGIRSRTRPARPGQNRRSGLSRRKQPVFIVAMRRGSHHPAPIV